MDTAQHDIILSTAYLPPISWMKAAINGNKVFIESYETYPRQTFRNRSRIISANGILPLIVPVKRPAGNSTPTRDVRIAYEEPWQRNHLRTIDTAYSNSPFYLYYMDELLPFYTKRYDFLLDYNMQLCNIICELLLIRIDFALTDRYQHRPEGLADLRNAFNPKSPVTNDLGMPYHQVFEERHGFIPDLSILDLLFNEGPGAGEYLRKKESE